MIDLPGLSQAVEWGNRNEAKRLTQELLNAGVAPLDIVEKGLVPGMSIVGEKFRNNKIFVPEILIAARAMKFRGQVELAGELANGRSTRALLRLLQSYSSDDEIVLVGHMPSLSEHLASLIGSKNPDGVPLGKGSIACLEAAEMRLGHGQLRWLMRQKQLRQLAS